MIGHSHWFWAKLGLSNTWPERYHPLVCHSLDVGHVAAHLWRHMCPNVRVRISEALGFDDDTAGRWVSFWIAAHDIGKLTPCFQLRGAQTDKLKDQLSGGFDCPACDPKHHTLTGTKILREALAAGGEGWPPLPDIAHKLSVAVGGHHGTFPTDWEGLTGVLGNDAWAVARHNLLNRLAKAFGVTRQTRVPSAAGPDQSVWMLLAGLTAVADWIGSNEEFFPWAGSPEPLDVEAYIAESNRLAERALACVGWHDRTPSVGPPRGFATATGIRHPRPLQREIVPLAEGITSPRLFLVEAPMGEGKTEAAWYVADCWDRRGGAGTYVALPTMATSNQMFDRVKRFLELAGGGNLMLQHGKAALNEQFDGLKYAARLYDPDGTSGVVAEGWFASNRKHGLLAPFGVGTIDQALLSVTANGRPEQEAKRAAKAAVTAFLPKSEDKDEHKTPYLLFLGDGEIARFAELDRHYGQLVTMYGDGGLKASAVCQLDGLKLINLKEDVKSVDKVIATAVAAAFPAGGDK